MLPVPRITLESVLAAHTTIAPAKSTFEYSSAARSDSSRPPSREYIEGPEPPPEEAGADEEFDPDEDPLLDRAIEVVVQAQTASTSLLQRRLRVGYTRAGRLIDMLERRGIISGYEGSKPRRVLIEEAQIDRVLS